MKHELTLLERPATTTGTYQIHAYLCTQCTPPARPGTLLLPATQLNSASVEQAGGREAQPVPPVPEVEPVEGPELAAVVVLERRRVLAQLHELGQLVEGPGCKRTCVCSVFV